MIDMSHGTRFMHINILEMQLIYGQDTHRSSKKSGKHRHELITSDSSAVHTHSTYTPIHLKKVKKPVDDEGGFKNAVLKVVRTLRPSKSETNISDLTSARLVKKKSTHGKKKKIHLRIAEPSCSNDGSKNRSNNSRGNSLYGDTLDHIEKNGKKLADSIDDIHKNGRRLADSINGIKDMILGSPWFKSKNKNDSEDKTDDPNNTEYDGDDEHFSDSNTNTGTETDISDNSGSSSTSDSEDVNNFDKEHKKYKKDKSKKSKKKHMKKQKHKKSYHKSNKLSKKDKVCKKFLDLLSQFQSQGGDSPSFDPNNLQGMQGGQVSSLFETSCPQFFTPSANSQNQINNNGVVPYGYGSNSTPEKAVSISSLNSMNNSKNISRDFKNVISKLLENVDSFKLDSLFSEFGKLSKKFGKSKSKKKRRKEDLSLEAVPSSTSPNCVKIKIKRDKEKPDVSDLDVPDFFNSLSMGLPNYQMNGNPFGNFNPGQQSQNQMPPFNYPFNMNMNQPQGQWMPPPPPAMNYPPPPNMNYPPPQNMTGPDFYNGSLNNMGMEVQPCLDINNPQAITGINTSLQSLEYRAPEPEAVSAINNIGTGCINTGNNLALLASQIQPPQMPQNPPIPQTQSIQQSVPVPQARQAPPGPQTSQGQQRESPIYTNYLPSSQKATTITNKTADCRSTCPAETDCAPFSRIPLDGVNANKGTVSLLTHLC